ncbi:hypothetical protein BH10PSE5_BH10PSE5_32110 [soil metagenome]
MTWRFAFQRPVWGFAATSSLAVTAGALVCSLSGVPAALWGRNLLAWLVASLAALALARSGGGRTLRVMTLLAPVALAASLFGDGQQGVHRWVDLGPLHINAAMVLAPPLVVSLAVLARGSGRWLVPGLLALGVLVAQPDASQATALALALCVVALGSQARPASIAWSAVALSLATLSWTRPDPLAPVAEVEEVIQLAAAVTPWLAALSVLALAAFAITPTLTARAHPRGEVRSAGLALSTLFLTWSLAPAFGAFPAPLVGIGLSPILGAWFGIGLLAGVAGRAPSP